MKRVGKKWLRLLITVVAALGVLAGSTTTALADDDLTIGSITALTYRAVGQEPRLTVKDGDTTLTKGADYTVSYAVDPTEGFNPQLDDAGLPLNAGQYKVTVTGVGTYEEKSAESTFKVNKLSIQSFTATYIKLSQDGDFFQGDAIPTVREIRAYKSGTYNFFLTTDEYDYVINDANGAEATSLVSQQKYTVVITGKGDNITGTNNKKTFTVYEEPVAIIESEGTPRRYSSVTSAFKAATSGQTVQVVKDTSETSPSFSRALDVTLDLNSHTLSGGLEVNGDNHGTLTITDSSEGKNGKITNMATDKYAINIYKAGAGPIIIDAGTITGDAGAIHNFGTLTISGNATITSGSADTDKTTNAIYNNGGTVNVTGGTIYALALNDPSYTPAGIWNYHGTVNISGGVVGSDTTDCKATGVVIYGNGTAGSATLNVTGGTIQSGSTSAITGNGTAEAAGTEINISGGTITSGGAGIYHPQSGTLNISDGSITGDAGIYLKSGVLNVTGGTISATGNKSDYEFIDSGYSQTGDAIVVDSCGYPGGAPSAKIKTATITSANGSAVGYYIHGNNAAPSVIAEEEYTLASNGAYVWVDNIDENTKATYPYMVANGYTVTLHANYEGADPASVEQGITKGVATALKENPFTRAGYIFSGWNTVAGGTDTSYADQAAVTLNSEDLDLYAQWKLAVAQINKDGTTTQYESLDKAVKAAQSGDTIELVADDNVSLTNKQEIIINKALTIDGGGYTVYGTNNYAGYNDVFIQGNGDVTIRNITFTQFGNHKSTASGHAPIWVSSNASTGFFGKLTLKNVNVSSFNRTGIYIGRGTFEIDGCTINCSKSTDYGYVLTKGIQVHDKASGTIQNTTIEGATSTYDEWTTSGIEVYGSGEVVINNCTISGLTSGIATSNAGYSATSMPNDTGAATVTISGCNIDVSNIALDAMSPAEVSVSGGTFEGAYAASASRNGTIDITGGAYTGTLSAIDGGTIKLHGGTFAGYGPAIGESGSITIDGGKFDAFDEDRTKNCVNGYVAFDNTDSDKDTYPYIVLPAATVTFNANFGDTPETATQIVPKSISTALDANTFSRQDGYSFAGWNTATGGTGTPYTNQQSVTLTADLELFAQWTADVATAPTISAQPQALSLIYGYTEGSVSVVATASTDTTYGDLTYQWYSNTRNSNTGGTKIDDATGASYDIPTGKNAGTTEYYYCAVTATRTDNNQTATKTSDVAKVTVGKANPIAAAPTGLTATYGDTLADVSLTGKNPTTNTPGTWKWANSSTSVGTVGNHAFPATFTPTDSGNYNSKSNVNVTVTVIRAANPATVTSTAVVMCGGNTVDLSDNVMLNGATGKVSYAIIGEANGCSLSGSVLKSGNSTGSVTVNVTVAADENHNALATTPITITIIDKNTQTITAEKVTATYGDTDKKVNATTDGDGTISYAVKSGSENYIDIASDGKLTIKKVPPTGGKAYVTVTASETATYAQATKEVTVTINKANATPATVTANNRTYDGAEKPLVTVTGTATGGEMQYTLGTATEATGTYSTSIPAATDAGTYHVWYRVAGDGNHEDSDAVVVEVTVAKAASAPATVSPLDRTYDGTEKPLVSVDNSTLSGGQMRYALGTADGPEGSYAASVPAAADAGTYHVWYRVAGDANHEDSDAASVEVAVQPRPVTLTASSGKRTYNGKAQKLSGFKSSVAGLEFEGVSASGSGTDAGEYEVALSGVEPGVTRDVTGNNVVASVAAGTLTIAPANISKAKVTLGTKTFDYDGKAKKPAVKTATLAGHKLVAGTDYRLSYNNNKALGTGSAVLTGRGNYTGTATATFRIQLARPELGSTVSLSKLSITVTWAEVAGAESYELQWREQGSEKWSSATVKGTKRVIKGLKSGACYDVRVRAKAGTSTLGPWSWQQHRWLQGVTSQKASSTKKGQAKVTWTAVKGADFGYVVVVTQGGSSHVDRVAVGKTDTTVTGLKSGAAAKAAVRPERKLGGIRYVGVLTKCKKFKVMK